MLSHATARALEARLRRRVGWLPDATGRRVRWFPVRPRERWRGRKGLRPAAARGRSVQRRSASACRAGSGPRAAAAPPSLSERPWTRSRDMSIVGDPDEGSRPCGCRCRLVPSAPERAGHRLGWRVATVRRPLLDIRPCHGRMSGFGDPAGARRPIAPARPARRSASANNRGTRHGRRAGSDTNSVRLTGRWP